MKMISLLLLTLIGIVFVSSLTSAAFEQYTRSWVSGSGSGLPGDTESFNWVELNFQVSGTSGTHPGYCGVYNLTSDPAGQSNANLWTDMKDGASFNSTATAFNCGLPGNYYNNLTNVGKNEMFSKWQRGENMSVGIALVKEQHWAALNIPYFIINYDTSNKAPILNFTYPSPPNATVSNVPYFDVNVSIIDEDLNWFTFHLEAKPYDYSVLRGTGSFPSTSYYNFENLSVLGETNSLITDVNPDTENNDITLYNNPTFTSTGCMYGKCLYLNGVNQYGEPASPDPGYWHNDFNRISYTFWIKADDPTDTNAGQVIFEEGGSYSGAMAYLNNSQLYWCLQNAGDLDILNFTYPNDGKGHAIYLTWAGDIDSNMTMYLDGSPMSSQITSFSVVGYHASNPFIGYSTDALTPCDNVIGYYAGTIDEFSRVNNRYAPAYVDVMSRATINKVNSTYWNFYVYNLTGYWNMSNDWHEFQQDTWYYHYSNSTDLVGKYNKTELRQWKWTIISVINDKWEVAVIFGFCSIAFIIFGLGRAFNKDNWMVKMGLYTFAMITSLVVVSAAQIFNEVSVADMMMAATLLIMVVSLSVIFLYLLVITFIGISKNLSQKQDEIWPT